MKYYLVYLKPMLILAENEEKAAKNAQKMLKNGYKGEVDHVDTAKITENAISL